MTAARSHHTARVQPATGCLLTQSALLLDAVAVASSVVLVRLVMAKSPLFDATAAQWQPLRYYVAAGIGAVLYVALAWAGGMYRIGRAGALARLPLMNFLNCVAMLGTGMLACARYAAANEDAALLARRALFFAAVLAYVLTTLVHYSCEALAAGRRSSLTAQETS